MKIYNRYCEWYANVNMHPEQFKCYEHILFGTMFAIISISSVIAMIIVGAILFITFPLWIIPMLIYENKQLRKK